MKKGRGPGLVELVDVPAPAPGSGEALIKVAACGVCNSDIHIWHDTQPYTPPVILGHEMSGVVVDVGQDAAGLAAGDAITAELHYESCGTCPVCRRSRPQLCPSKKTPGRHSPGAMAEFVALPAWLLRKVPQNVDLQTAAITEPLSVAVSALITLGRVKPSDTVVVLGAGPIGILAAMAAKAVGVQSLFIAPGKRSAARRERAKMFLPYGILDPLAGDPVAMLKDASAGWGADLVIEATGTEEGIRLAALMAARGGRIVFAGITGREEILVQWDRLVFSGIEVRFVFSSGYGDFINALTMLAGGLIDSELIITHRIPLDQWEEGFTAARDGWAVKALLIP